MSDIISSPTQLRIFYGVRIYGERPGPGFILTSFVRVTKQGFLLSSEPRTRPMFHPGCYGELICQVLWYHPVWDFSRLTPIKPEDQVTVPAAVSHQGSCPVGGGAGGREKVSAAR